MAAKVDLSEFVKLSRPKRRPCVVGRALLELEPAERAQLEAALATDQGIITTGAIKKWLEARGQDASVPGISTHRRGGCNCE